MHERDRSDAIPPDHASREAGRGAVHPRRTPAEQVTRGVSWAALRGVRTLRRGLRRAGVPLPRFHTFRRRSPVGSPPGTLISHPEAEPPPIHVMGFSADAIEELDVAVADLGSLVGRWPVVWVDVHSVGHAESVEAIGAAFNLHRLALEDVMNVHQRPKVEEYADYLFAAVRMAALGERVDTEQITMFLGAGWVLTFQEAPGDCWEPIRDRLRQGKGRIRAAGADYLFYSLLDATIDNYYPVLEEFGARLELLEEEVLMDPRQEVVGIIHSARRDLLALRHAIWPMREAVGQLYRDPTRHIGEDTRLYLRDGKPGYLADIPRTLSYVKGMLLGQVSPDQLAGPLGIAQISGQAASISFAALHHAELYLLDGDHRLGGVLPQIDTAFAVFLDDLA
mgnify:CR=1 FL=1